MPHQVVLIPGDGIGPEVTEAVRRIVAASKAPVTWVEHTAGLAALEAGHDTVLPEQTTAAIRQHGVALKGPCTTPIGKGFASINVALRQKLQLYAAVRPIRSLAGVPTRFENVDLVVVRENTEGLYSGIENVITEGVVTSLKVATRAACQRIAAFAFRYARSRKRRLVTVFHKANIMKLTDGLFLECARAEHAEYPEIDYQETIIDAACMRLVREPADFDVLLCENLYGDVVSDLCAGLVGGLGVTPGANFGETMAVFEAVHGTAPDIAGRGVANPLALLMSAVMMLNHLADKRQDTACGDAARRIRDAYNACLMAGRKTRDLGGDLSTAAFADAVISAAGNPMKVSEWSIPGAEGKPILGNAHLPAGKARGVVIIAHGFKGYKDFGMFPRLAGALALGGFIAHRFNFSHSGMTSHVETFQRPDLFQRDTWNKQVFDLLAVIVAVSGGTLPGAGLPLVLLGHSRGGATCLLTAGRHADDPAMPPVAGVVSIASPDTLNSLSPDEQRELLKRGSMETHSSRTGQSLRVGRAFLDEQLRDPVAHDLLSKASRIRCPVLIVHGSDDTSVPPAAAARLAERLGDRATARLIEGADHVFNTPNPLREDTPTSPQLAKLLEAVVEFVGEKRPA